MVGTNMGEELDCGNFFDQIDDLLEFPNADIEDGFVGNGVSSLWPDPGSSLDSELLGSDPFFSHSPSDLSTELSAPYEDIVQLEWLSTFVEDCLSSGGLTLDKSSTRDSSPNQFQTSSPVSVLESSSTCSNMNPIPISHEKRARTKRPRPATFTPRLSIIPPTSSIPETEPQKKKKTIKILPPSGSSMTNQNQNQNENENQEQEQDQNANAQGVRKCMHCEITKTPQWRTGPMGPKSLCNACGVRYKSGRLFPEYRPAASPTFVPTLHSNSHKKVIEMRTKHKTSTA